MKPEKKLMVALIIGAVFALHAPVDAASDAKAPAAAASQPAAATAPAAQPAAAPADPKPEVKPAPEKKELTQEWWQLALSELIKLIFLVLGTAATGFVLVLSRKYKFGLEREQIADIVGKATSFAEQKAIKAAKLDGKPTAAAEKMDIALSFAKSMALKYKLKDKGEAFWEDQLESWLGVENKGEKPVIPEKDEEPAEEAEE